MKKKAFTLIELLAVIVLIIIIGLIFVPDVLKLISKSQTDTYSVKEKMISRAGEDYTVFNKIKLPTNPGEEKLVDIETLITQDFMTPVYDLSNKDETCLGYLIIQKNTTYGHNYKACLFCSDYKTEDSDCNIDNMGTIGSGSPTLLMYGNSPYYVELGSTYVDPGCAAHDYDGVNITNRIVKTGLPINTSNIGINTVTYSVQDANGISATPVSRQVVVRDTTPPSVAFGTNGNRTPAKTYSSTVTVTDLSGLSQLKYLWSNSASTPSDDSFVNTFTSGQTINSPSSLNGTYYLWIYAQDNNNNIAKIKSNPFIFDNTPPAITLNGSSTVSTKHGDAYTDLGATASDNIDGNITSKIIKSGTVDVNTIGKYTITYTVTDTAGNAATPVTRTVNVVWVNPPVLAQGMTPIKWNGSAWVDTVTTDNAWYDYENKQWANARTADGSMWVWIPRYIYKISGGWHTNTAGTIDIQFTKNTNDNWNSAVIGNIDTGTASNASNNKWTNHPAFTFGTTELTGIWVAKFEASVSNTSDACYTSASIANCNKTTLIPKMVPNVKSWRYITVGNMFTVTRNMETNAVYGWGTSGVGIDTHMMKNVEWGAVAYLSKSLYGQDTNEIWINPANDSTTGCAGDSVSSASTTGCLRTYETTNGVKASTTGNIYGIYDMSGGTWEYTASYINNGNSNLTTNGNSIITAANQYKDIYTAGSTDSDANNYTNAISLKGDAVYETSNSYLSGYSWYVDWSFMPNTTGPWFYRGGYYSDGTLTGTFGFCFSNGSGGAGSVGGFRSVLAVNAGL